MKKWLRNIFQFMAISVLLYFPCMILWAEIAPYKYAPQIVYRPGINGFLNKRIIDANQHGPVDILFIGSSHTYRGFDPRIFEKEGLTIFTMGSSSQTPQQSLYFAKKYVDHFQPRLVVIDVYPKTMSYDGIESTIDIFSNANVDWNSAEMALDMQNLKVINTYVYSWYMNLTNPDSMARWPTKLKYDEYIPHGYVEKDPSFRVPDDGEPTQYYQPYPENLEDLEELIGYLDEKNCDYLLVYTPVQKSYYNSFANNDEFIAQMKAFGEFWNFNPSYFLNDSLHFYDDNHLSQEGVKQFNRAFIQRLKKRDSVQHWIREKNPRVSTES